MKSAGPSPPPSPLQGPAVARHSSAVVPHSKAAAPHCFAATPHSIAAAPQCPAAAPHSIAPAPQSIAQAPHSIARPSHASLARSEAFRTVTTRPTQGERTCPMKAERALLELQQRVADRHLTAEQRSAIRAVLVSGGPPGGKISVTCFGSDPEPCRFAAQIVDVLRTSGWLVDFGPNSQFLPVGTVARGVFVRTKNPDIHRAAVLQAALVAAGIPCRGEVRADAEEGWVDLLVAFKP